MKRKRRWSFVGVARFSSVPILLHILLTLGRVRVMDARDAKYLVVSTNVPFCGTLWRVNGSPQSIIVTVQTTSTVTSTVTIGASYCFTTKKLFFGALTPRCADRRRGKRAIDVEPIPGASRHRNEGDIK